jgi:hypothetical protein
LESDIHCDKLLIHRNAALQSLRLVDDCRGEQSCENHYDADGECSFGSQLIFQCFSAWLLYKAATGLHDGVSLPFFRVMVIA